MPQGLRIEIRGAVQGVGFRPFVYRLADELGLSGWVVNDVRGVTVEADGPRDALERLVERIVAERPAVSVIESIDTEWSAPHGHDGFEIRHSDDAGEKTVQVLPDVATCNACASEVLDPDDRRHLYPFTNCTHCGPRFSIVRSLPYDRPRTTMDRFTMCERCRAEYDDPKDRRFHAQPNACPECGPGLELTHATGEVRARGHDALREAAAALYQGAIVAVKGLGGFHLMVDARNGPAIERLRDRKPRRDKPFAVMVADLDAARALCEVDDDAAAALASPEAPILLLPRRPGAPVHEAVAPGNPTLGVMVAYTPLHHLLMRETGFPVVATSGNLSEEPICTSEDDAARRLGPIADVFLVHDRPIARHVDDSVAWRLDGHTRVLRRARGFAPRPLLVDDDLPTVLAVGAHLKNAVALSVGRRVFVSQHIGDMETAESLRAFHRVVEDFLTLYGAEPVALAHDLHPDYVTTRWALEAVSEGIGPLRGLPRVAVQHHHAHLASCLLDAGERGPALGITWDGTGFGTDATVWGGEMLLGDAAGFRRVAHLRTFRLPGGETAVREPRRSALSLLWETIGPDETMAHDRLECVREFTPAERDLLSGMLAKGVNSPVTSSAGRLFDGVASLAGLSQVTSFEGQAAMALEFAADPDERGAYPIALETRTVDTDADPDTDARARAAGEQRAEGDTVTVLDWRPLVEAVLQDRLRGVSAPTIAARFHHALVEAMVQVAGRVGEETVALSGGCFQNRRLTEAAPARLRAAGHRVVLHRRVPPNDGGIAPGQVASAAARLR